MCLDSSCRPRAFFANVLSADHRSITVHLDGSKLVCADGTGPLDSIALRECVVFKNQAKDGRNRVLRASKMERSRRNALRKVVIQRWDVALGAAGDAEEDTHQWAFYMPHGVVRLAHE